MNNQTIENLWTLRDEIIDARIDEKDVEICRDMQEQIDLLGNLAEALDAGADVMCDCLTCQSMIGAYDVNNRHAKTDTGRQKQWSEANIAYYLKALKEHLDRPFQHGGDLVIMRSKMFIA